MQKKTMQALIAATVIGVACQLGPGETAGAQKQPRNTVEDPVSPQADALKSRILSETSTFSEKVKIDIDPARLFYSTLGGGILATVPAKGLEKLDPKNLPKTGVDIGIVLLTVPITTRNGQQVPAGVYKARWIISKGTAELLNEQGKTVAAVVAKAPKLGQSPQRDSSDVRNAIYTRSHEGRPRLRDESCDTCSLKPAQFAGGGSFTRCYGLLLFCCETRNPYFGGETICRWCGFCFGLWW